ncbi:MAG: hypothetical protein Fur003_2090 [Candidatus Dojkabacteria bacterium]
MKLVIFIPAFNEEATIEKVIKSIPRLKQFSDQKILVVNDGSKDRTALIAKKAGAIVVSHIKNSGVGKAFQTGVENALKMGVDIMVTIDADGQFPISQIEKLIEPILKQEADFVTATRFFSKDEYPKDIGPVKLWGNRQIAKIISKITKQKFSDVACGFRAYSKEALLNLNTFGVFTYTQEVFIDLSLKNLKIVEIPISGIVYFKGRKSRVFKGVFDYAFKSIAIILRTLRDYKPLKMFAFPGIVLFLLGIFCEILLFLYYLANHQFSPYIFVGFTGAALNLLGLLFVIIGLVADMLGRLRANQERILYNQKRQLYENSTSRSK